MTSLVRALPIETRRICGVELGEIVGRARDALGVPIAASVAYAPAQLYQLSEAERVALRTLTSHKRIRSWLRGRAALKALVTGPDNTDTTRLAFPHPRYSLTHTGDVAVAVSCAGVHGVGVDLEFDRPISPRSMSYYLADHEAKWVGGIEPEKQDAARLRLWTLKEALFKADPHNENRVLSDYVVDDPAAWSGACISAPRIAIRFFTLRLPLGFLTFSVAKEAA